MIVSVCEDTAEQDWREIGGRVDRGEGVCCVLGVPDKEIQQAMASLLWGDW